LLLSVGYEPIASEEHRQLQKKDPGRSYQGYDLAHPETRVIVDLQERPGVRYSSFHVDMDELWSRHIIVNVSGIQLPTLSKEDCVLVLCAHGTQHRWQKLKWVCDLAELLRTHPDMDWDRIWATAD